MPQPDAINPRGRLDGTSRAQQYAFGMGASGALAVFSFFLATQLWSHELTSRAALGFYTFIGIGVCFGAAMVQLQVLLAQILDDDQVDTFRSIGTFLATFCIPIVAIGFVVKVVA